MTSWLDPFLQWIAHHPHGAGLAVFAVAATEGLLVLGLLVPGVLLMFGVGALVANGTMSLASTLAWAAGGAFCGDALSFLLGRHYRGHLQERWPFSRYPAILGRGGEFFHRHGGKSVILGRFVGPMRPIVPAVAGAAGMPPARFAAFDMLAAALWSPAYILPGVVFGASLGLAAKIASRLVVLVLLVLGIVWGVVWLTRNAFAVMQPVAESLVLRLLDWSQRHRRLGRLGQALTDPRQPEAPALAVLALGLLAAAWLACLAAWGFGSPVRPWRVDTLVYQVLRGLHTAWTNPIAVVLGELGDWRVYVPVAAAVLVHLAWVRRYRAAMHWGAAVAFAAVLAGGLHLLVRVPPPAPLARMLDPGFGGGHTILSTVIYGFLPVLATTGRRRTGRWPYYGAAGSLILLIALARLYLGTQWLSITLISLGAGLAWVALLGLAYRRHNARAVPRTALAISALAVLATAGAWRCAAALPAYMRLTRAATAEQSMGMQSWLADGFARLPAHRIDLPGTPRLPLNVQWAGAISAVRSALAERGWHQPPHASAAKALLWLDAGTPIEQLPVLPQFHDGRREALVMIQPIDAAHERVIRLWASHWRLAQPESAPLWLGVVARARVHPILSLVYLPAIAGDFAPARRALARDLATVPAVCRRRPDNGQAVLLVAPLPGQRRPSPQGSSRVCGSPSWSSTRATMKSTSASTLAGRW